MHSTVDTIIIGAGITGCALIHELSKQTNKKICLIEKHHIASGTTGQSGGLVRKMFQPPDLISLACESFDYYQRFHEETGFSCDFIKTGCEYWLPEQTSPIYEETAGCINTTLACESWVKSALNHSAAIVLNEEVTELLLQHETIVGVKTNHSTINCAQVIITAGAWSGALLQSHGNQLAIEKKSFKYHYYHQQKPALQSVIIDFQQQCYFIPTRDNRIIAGSLTDEDHQNYSRLDPATYISTHIAVDAFTDNAAGIVSNVEDTQGLYIATGWSGGGIKIAPAVAKKMVNLLTC